MIVRLLCTIVQLADHTDHSNVTDHSPSQRQKVHKVPLQFIRGDPSFYKYNIIFIVEYCTVNSHVLFYCKLYFKLVYLASKFEEGLSSILCSFE